MKLADEVRTLGIVVSSHPLTLFRPRIERFMQRRGLGPLVSSPDIPRHKGQAVWMAGILVTGKEVATKKREPMIFVSFEDEQSVFETVLFPSAFDRYYPLLDDGWAFLIHGRVQDDQGALAISVDRLVRVSRREGEGDDAVAPDARSQAGEGRRELVAAGMAVAPDRPPLFMWGREGHRALQSG